MPTRPARRQAGLASPFQGNSCVDAGDRHREPSRCPAAVGLRAPILSHRLDQPPGDMALDAFARGICDQARFACYHLYTNGVSVRVDVQAYRGRSLSHGIRDQFGRQEGHVRLGSIAPPTAQHLLDEPSREARRQRRRLKLAAISPTRACGEQLRGLHFLLLPIRRLG
jgi:hypothetical protein